MAVNAHRIVKGLSWGCALLLGAGLLSGCAAPQYTYVTDSSDLTYFKVPHDWSKLTPAALCTAVEQYYTADTCPTRWTTAYYGGQDPSASDFSGLNLSQPFVYAGVAPNAEASESDAPLTDQELEDEFMPVSASTRATAAKNGYALTDFRQLASSTVKISGGFWGVHEVFDYSVPSGATDTFNEVVLTNSASTQVYLLILHCTSSCYQQNQTAIDAVMSSFTVRSH